MRHDRIHQFSDLLNPLTQIEIRIRQLTFVPALHILPNEDDENVFYPVTHLSHLFSQIRMVTRMMKEASKKDDRLQTQNY